MKIKRRKKNDRTAFFFMNALAYFKYRLAINPERRLDKTFPPQTLQQRDRLRADKFQKDFKKGAGWCPKCGGPMTMVNKNAVLDAPLVPGCCKCGWQIVQTADVLGAPCDP